MKQEKMHIMLDLETMSSEANAAIVAIGACRFDQKGVYQTFYSVVDLKSCQKRGLHIDADTVMWWLTQSDKARAAIGGGARGVDIADALVDLSHWVNCLVPLGDDKPHILVYGNGSDFDNVVLRNAYKAAGLDPFWSFRGNRCYRTMRNFLRSDGDEQPFEGERHIASDDAVHQAKQLIACLNRNKLVLE